MTDNPLLVTTGLPHFEAIKAAHVEPAVSALLQRTRADLARLEAEVEPTWEGLMQPLEALEHPFEYAWGPVGHLLGVRNSKDLREAHEAVLPEVVDFSLQLHQSKPLFKALEELRAGAGWQALPPAQQRAVELRLRSARLAGVGLEGEARQRFNEISQEVSQLCTTFANNVLDATKAVGLDIVAAADTEGWPESLRQLAAQSYNDAEMGSRGATPAAGPWRITLDLPSYLPFMRHSRQRHQRDLLYRAYLTRASSGERDNTPVLERILELRQEKARLLGFDSYAELSLESKMSPDVPSVWRMVEELASAARPHAERELAELRTYAAEHGHPGDLLHHDVAFWEERLREERFAVTDEVLRPYFPLPRVLQGLFGLSERLFGVRIEAADGDMPVWHQDVRCFSVRDGDGSLLASFYLDPYSRPHEKRGGAWKDDCLNRCRVNGELQLPVVYLCCNGTPPVGEGPSLMSFREVETLFHEFGHGLQSMLTTVDEGDVAGTNGIERDAIELASQFMENWCYHRPTLRGMTAHIETGEPLPDELFEKLVAARTYHSAIAMMKQLEYAVVDLRLHSEYRPGDASSAHEVQQRTTAEFSPLPPLAENRFLCSFSHIFAGGYAAGYYSYKWAEVLSADAFAAFEEVGLDDADAVAQLGRKYRETILALGGSQHPAEVFRAFRGREPSTAALLRHNGVAAAS